MMFNFLDEEDFVIHPNHPLEDDDIKGLQCCGYTWNPLNKRWHRLVIDKNGWYLFGLADQSDQS